MLPITQVFNQEHRIFPYNERITHTNSNDVEWLFYHHCQCNGRC